MTEIKKIDKISLAKISALIHGLGGFIITILVALSTMINIIMQQDFTGSILMVILFNSGAGLLLGILSTLIMSAIGFIVGWLGAAIYNVFAKKYGGIRLEMAEETPKPIKSEQAINQS